MAVLVTGGAGYIGSHTVRALRDAGRDVVVLDSLEYGHLKAIPDVPFVKGDISNQTLITQTIAAHKVDSIIHFAAYKAAGESMEQPERYFDNNVAHAHAMLRAAHTAGVKRVVFSSTCAVYGTPKIVPVNEQASLGPESPYGESKLMFEKILQWYDRCHGVTSVSLRYFNAAGASMEGGIGEDWTVSLNLVPIVMKSALERRGPVEVFGTDYPTPDGTAIRDYIHVDDLAAAHLLALRYLEDGGATTAINLGTGVGSSVREVLDTTERISGVRIPRTLSPRRAGDPIQVFADNTAAKKVLGWTPVYGLDEIIQSAWTWHSTHLDGFADERSV
jgi:UDP-glucose-4-epimerase GalE